MLIISNFFEKGDRKFLMGKIPYGENSLWGKFLIDFLAVK